MALMDLFIKPWLCFCNDQMVMPVIIRNAMAIAEGKRAMHELVLGLLNKYVVCYAPTALREYSAFILKLFGACQSQPEMRARNAVRSLAMSS